MKQKKLCQNLKIKNNFMNGQNKNNQIIIYNTEDGETKFIKIKK